MNEFKEVVWSYYHKNARVMPWRDDPSFYHVLVSEIMLQQTQVARVLVKYAEFLEQFPRIADLAAAPLAQVLTVWQGLGYNRRARFLHQAAKHIVETGQPNNLAGLMALPGVGHNTAAAIMNYAYEVPVPYVETNIRTVYFYHFFPNQVEVSDKQILALVEQTLDAEHPREWFWALMDYGAYLKSHGLGCIKTSKHYVKQAPLKGSVREVRGAIIRALAQQHYSLAQLKQVTPVDERFSKALSGLVRDGLVTKTGAYYHLTN